MENSNNQLYTIADIARHFQLPESTCRYYCKRFSSYIPSVGEGRRRRFRKDTIAVLTTIIEEMKKSRTCTAVEEVLAVRYPRTTYVVRQPKQSESEKELDSFQDNDLDGESSNQMLPNVFPPLALEYMERQTNALEGIAKMLGVLASNFCTPALPDKNNAQVDQLNEDIKSIRLMLETNEKNQQADLEQLRNWIHRIVRKMSPQTNQAASM